MGLNMDVSEDVFAKTSYGKAALNKLAPTPDNFRIYEAGWLGRHLREFKVMKVTGAEFRLAKTGLNAGKMSIMVKGSKRTVYLTKDEIGKFEFN